MKEKLIQQLGPLKDSSANLSQAVKVIRDTKMEVETQGGAVANHIQTSFEQLHVIIEVCKQELLAESAKKVSEKMERLSNQEKQLSTACAVVQSVIDYTEQCVEHSADDEVMSMHTEIQRRIDKEIQEQLKDVEPEEADIGVAVNCAEDLKQLCQTKARMITLDYTATSEGLASAEVNKASDFQVAIKFSNGKPVRKTQDVECSSKAIASGVITKCEVSPLESGKYRIKYTPTVRGRHDLTVTVNGREVSSASSRVFVSIPPTQQKKPVRAVKIETPYDIAMTSSGEVVIARYVNLVLMNGGKVVNSYGQQNVCFFAVAVDGTNDNVYAVVYTDSHNEVMKLSPDLKLLKRCKVNKRDGRDDLQGVEVVGDEVVVCDCNGTCVKVYTKELEFVRQIPLPGHVHDVSSDEDGNLYVSDYSNERIRVLNNAGAEVRSFSSDCSSPYGVCVSGEHVFVVDCGRDYIAVLTLKGEPVTRLSQRGNKTDDIYSARGVCVDKDGFFYVCDHNNHRIQIF